MRVKRIAVNLAKVTDPLKERHVLGGDFILAEVYDVDAVWGTGQRVLWPYGEALVLAGGVGAGKSTILQQLILHGIGIRKGPFLDLDVRFPKGIVGYVAADRPSQIRRSWRRMVTHADEQALNARLDVWRGALPFDLATAKAGALAEWVVDRGWSVLAIDSLKDVTSGTTDDDDGLAINRQLQEVLVRDVQVVLNHHDRKADGKSRGGPKTLDDLYGSRWIGAGAGSVVHVAGDSGDDEVTMRHLKVPADRVGPLALRHDHATGTTVVLGAATSGQQRASGQGPADVLAYLQQQSAKVTTADVAAGIGASVRLANRWLSELKRKGDVDGARVGTAPTSPMEWWAV